MTRPLGRTEEWSTANDLRYIQVWFEEGGWKNKFALNANYPSPADKNIINNINNDPATIYHDKKGNFYYVSFPPFSLIFPWLIFKLLHVYPDVLSLKWIGVFLHFVAGFFVYRIVGLVVKTCGGSRGGLPGLVAFAVYMFAPGPLFWWTNVYIPEIAVQALFAVTLYLFLRLILSNENSFWDYAWYGIAHFFMNYTEWLGFCFALTAGLLALSRIRQKKYQIILLITALTVISAWALTLWQYAQVNNFEALLKAMVARYRQRGGGLLTSSHWQMLDVSLWRNVAHYYKDAYGYFFVAIAVLTAARFLFLKKRIFSADRPATGRFKITVLILAALPALFYHLIFFNTVCLHPFYVITTGLSISVLAGLVTEGLLKAVRETILPRFGSWAVGTFLIIIVASAAVFSVSKYRGDFRHSTESFKTLGEYIGQVARPDEVVFLNVGLKRFMANEEYKIAPETVLYAHRNIAPWEGEAKARNLMKLNGVRQAIVFRLDYNVNNAVIRYDRSLTADA
jgi:hypothetical protein